MRIYWWRMINLNSDIVPIDLNAVHGLFSHLCVVFVPKLYDTAVVLILNSHMSGPDQTIWPKDLIQLRICEARWELLDKTRSRRRAMRWWWL